MRVSYICIFVNTLQVVVLGVWGGGYRDLLSCVYFFGFVIGLAFCNIVFVSFKFVFYCVILVFVYCTYICISRASGHSLDCVARGLSVIHPLPCVLLWFCDYICIM